MRGIKFVFLVAVAMAGLTLSTGVGASTGKGSAPAKASGAHIQKVIVNGSVQKNAAIPARVQRLLKKAADIPGRSCPHATTSTSASDTAVQTCTWGDATTPYTGPVTCIQISNKATATQTCDITQASDGANNTALIIQIIWSQNPPSGQNGTQIVKLRQKNTSPSNANNTGGNSAGIGQYIKQSLGRGTPDDTEEGDVEPDAPATLIAPQKQESHQVVHLRQDSMVGANNAPILQFLRQRERASNSATTQQDQNVDLASPLHTASVCATDAGSDQLFNTVVVDQNANQCILSNQTSVSGTQSLGLGGDYNQLQRARKARYGHQVQGTEFTGGSDYGLIQSSSGVSKVLTIQNERQVQRGIQVGSTADFQQSQNGPRKGSGSAQLGNSADTWTGRQTSAQIQTRTLLPSFMKVADLAPSGQTNILVYSAKQLPAGPGNMDVKQTVRQNNGTPVTRSCSASPCEIAIVCVTGEGCTPAPECTEGDVIDPTTGQCTSYCNVFPSAPSCDYFTSIAPSLYQRSLYRQRR